MFLFFDTETTGLPRDWRAPVNDLDNWPRLVQLAWLLVDAQGKEAGGANRIIKPDGFIIPDGAASVHGITTARAMSEGIELDAALREFAAALEPAKIIVAHNINFDRMVMGAELLRRRVEHPLFERPGICTMESATDYCQLPSNNGRGYKWPKLIELHHKLFDTGFDGAHDALADVRACARCFFELAKREVIK